MDVRLPLLIRRLARSIVGSAPGVLVLALVMSAVVIDAQVSRRGDIVWACSQHSDQVSTAEGKCPICGLPLEAVHLDSEWTCPEHQAYAEDGPGRCPICKRDFVKVTVTRYYTCPQSTLHELEPGNCADGEARIEVKHRQQMLQKP